MPAPRYHAQKLTADGHWLMLPYRFASRNTLNAFLRKLRAANPGHEFRGGVLS